MSTTAEPGSPRGGDSTGGPITGADDTATDTGSEDVGYHHSLKPRQIQMIAIGGAIGSGLFLGAGERLHDAGPGLFALYAIAGVFVFFVLRALGELIVHRPTSGSFVSYAREFLGEHAAFAAGWMYFLNWAFTCVVDSTAIATYLHYWGVFAAVPQWLFALISIVLVFAMNAISVKLFGEFEFWAALVKVTAIIIFLIIGVVFVIGRFHIETHTAGLGVVAHDHGWLPHGIVPLITVSVGIVFAYAGSELVGVAAGEAENPRKVLPKAINSVVLRICIFYVGSVLLLALLVPSSQFESGVSPFVTFFDKIGVPGAGGIMTFVVLTAAFSSLNSGLYSTGRTLRSMALAGTAPRFTGVISSRGIPWGGIALTGVFGGVGVFINLVAPSQAFEIVLNIASLGVITAWATIILCQLALMRKAERGEIERPSFRMIGAPWTSYLTLVFLAAVLVIMAFDWPIGSCTVLSLGLIIPALIIGWFAVRHRVYAIAAKRGDTY